MTRDSTCGSLKSNGQTENRLANPPSEEPDALITHLRVCEGPGRQHPCLLGTRGISLLMLAGALVLATGRFAWGVDYTWTGAGDGSNWTDTANWDVGGSYPNSNTHRALFTNAVFTNYIGTNITIAHIGMTQTVDNDQPIWFRTTTTNTLTFRNDISVGAVPLLDQWACRFYFDTGTYVVDDTALKSIVSDGNAPYRQINFNAGATLSEGPNVTNVDFINNTRLLVYGSYDLNGEILVDDQYGENGYIRLSVPISSARQIRCQANSTYGAVGLFDATISGTTPVILEHGGIYLTGNAGWAGNIVLQWSTPVIWSSMFYDTATLTGDISNPTGVCSTLTIQSNTGGGVPNYNLNGNIDLVGASNVTIIITNKYTVANNRGPNLNLATNVSKFVMLTNGATTLTIDHEGPGYGYTNTGITTFGALKGNGIGQSSHLKITGNLGGQTNSQIVVALSAVPSNYYGTITLTPASGSDDTNVLAMTNGDYLGHASVGGVGIIRSTNTTLQLLETISPGTNAAGTLNIEGSVHFNTGSKYQWEPGDMLEVSSNLTAGGAWTLEMTNMLSPASSSAYVVAHASSVDSAVASSGTPSVARWRLQIRPAGGGGQNLVLQLPPGTIVTFY